MRDFLKKSVVNSALHKAGQFPLFLLKMILCTKNREEGRLRNFRGKDVFISLYISESFIFNNWSL